MKDEPSETEAERGNPNEQSGGTICTTAPVSHAVGRRSPQGVPLGDIFKNSQKSELPFGYLALLEAGKYDG